MSPQIDRDGQIILFDDAPDYNAFVDKFKSAKTTDDCYTPDNIHEAVTAWVRHEYKLDESVLFIRPFWPGADFEALEYPENCVVVDNPPFSLRAHIVDYYQRRGVRFFLYSPALSLLTRRAGVCHIAVGVSITYENGAKVPTSFITNLEPHVVLRTAPDLYRAVYSADRANLAAEKKELPKYIYPDEVVTAAIAQRWCKYGVKYSLSAEDCVAVSALDAQKRRGISIFGCGLLLSERAAAERAAAERAAAERAAAEHWALSEREREIVKSMGGGSRGSDAE